jgi:polysaccharide biosynthesis/export protein VpsN
MSLRTLVVLGACALVVACGPETAAVRSPGAVVAPDLSAYRLGIGDKVRIDVFNEPDLSLEATVDPTGRISYPLLGSIDALRKTARQLQDEITTGLAGGYLVSPDVRVTVVHYRSFYVTGQVQRAGAYPYVVGLTVEKAIALAGGMTNLASSRKIYLLHEDQPADKRIRVGLDALVLPGDTLLIEESLF